MALPHWKCAPGTSSVLQRSRVSCRHPTYAWCISLSTLHSGNANARRLCEAL